MPNATTAPSAQVVPLRPLKVDARFAFILAAVWYEIGARTIPYELGVVYDDGTGIASAIKSVLPDVVWDEIDAAIAWPRSQYKSGWERVEQTLHALVKKRDSEPRPSPEREHIGQGIVPGSERFVQTGTGNPTRRFDYVDSRRFLYCNVTPTVVAVLGALTDDWLNIDDSQLPNEVNAATESSRVRKLRSAAMRLENAGVLDIKRDAEDYPLRACREGSFYVRARSLKVGGNKHLCGHCGAEFCDRNEDPIVCPQCHTVLETVTPNPTKALIEATVDMIQRHMPEENFAAVMVEFANTWRELIAKRQGQKFNQGGAPIARNCAVCGGAFVPQNRRQKTCSESCTKERQKANDRLMRATFRAAKELNLVTAED